MESDDLQKLSDRMLELQALQICLSAQIRALTFLSMKIWQEQGVQMPDSKSFPQVLQTMTDEQVHYILSSYSDFSPEGAARLKDCIEKSMKWQNPFA